METEHLHTLIVIFEVIEIAFQRQQFLDRLTVFELRTSQGVIEVRV